MPRPGIESRGYQGCPNSYVLLKYIYMPSDECHTKSLKTANLSKTESAAELDRGRRP